MLHGSITALVTPFKNGKVDEKALKGLIEFQIKSGIDAIVPCGTTGESATLSYEEHERVVELAIEFAGKKIPVIAGTGSNSTKETIMLTEHAKKAGADAVLLITPYYNKPTQEGLYQHYKAVAEAVDIPMILYNVPGRTGVNMLPETVARLSEIKNIVGIKEATGSLQQVSDTIEMARKDFIILSGDDFTTLPLLSVGGHGVISVTSNVAPKDVSQMCDAFFAGDIVEAKRLHYKLQPLHRAMFVETNPIPVKTALAIMGKVEEEFRLPLVKMGDANRKKLQKALSDYGVI
ncbi:MAG: 4-hydroxy-tetrahydrodipicolinate synthase [Deltaproteobacteria bacterium RIFCSPLOWO2_12_FULL_43_16]|nr:MAG: 4-hydroxy-tetrahydrodipicolinate synthase [Deltaproteobacteria bacterium GWA2_43_19]OGQ11248.1 MAG: 4-hydroxy-tetrahydrodipicolinate synthase [Deltaproteobacteria bacterium RIFCSPHIGHO2_02_FULL_43_33]OGQ60445.1 MAG: 4-hydroxy-tetrahydrodipicolinate synthase [Deltaproteobacteria bacterium RIFCSPLOWO2_12_FULL_43_16]HBR17456.1 4-hydroxy-tetrahydrodipicolinate synthase [Deltaproteobacteria bacterium]